MIICQRYAKIKSMYLVFNIGGTNLKVVVSSDKQTISRSKVIPTPTDFQQGMSALKQIAEGVDAGKNISPSTSSGFGYFRA